jgi:hypothetical protein
VAPGFVFDCGDVRRGEIALLTDARVLARHRVLDLFAVLALRAAAPNAENLVRSFLLN